MKIAVFSAKRYDREFLDAANVAKGTSYSISRRRLGPNPPLWLPVMTQSAFFVNDVADASVLEVLRHGGTKLVALRCTGFNNVDLATAALLGLRFSLHCPLTPETHHIVNCGVAGADEARCLVGQYQPRRSD